MATAKKTASKTTTAKTTAAKSTAAKTTAAKKSTTARKTTTKKAVAAPVVDVATETTKTVDKPLSTWTLTDLAGVASEAVAALVAAPSLVAHKLAADFADFDIKSLSLPDFDAKSLGLPEITDFEKGLAELTALSGKAGDFVGELAADAVKSVNQGVTMVRQTVGV